MVFPFQVFARRIAQAPGYVKRECYPFFAVMPEGRKDGRQAARMTPPAPGSARDAGGGRDQAVFVRSG